MAIPVKLPWMNSVRTAPPGMRECMDLPVHVAPDGRQISVWEITEEEAATILATRAIALTVWGPSHPVVGIGTVTIEAPAEARFAVYWLTGPGSSESMEPLTAQQVLPLVLSLLLKNVEWFEVLRIDDGSERAQE